MAPVEEIQTDGYKECLIKSGDVGTASWIFTCTSIK